MLTTVRHGDCASRVLFAAICLSGLNLFAQDSFLSNREEHFWQQPQGVNFTVNAAKSDFFLGEVIPLQLSFTATAPRTFLADSRLQDRVGRMNYVEEFVVDQVALTEDPLQGLPGAEGGMGGLSGGP